MKCFVVLIVGLSILSSGQSFYHLAKDKKVILILADGIRYDYVKDKSLVGFARMAKNGVKAEYVQPIFPSNSYPNWYTIVTGKLLLVLLPAVALCVTLVSHLLHSSCEVLALFLLLFTV